MAATRAPIRAYLPWVVGAVAILGVLFLIVGGGSVLTALSGADRWFVLATFVLGLCWLFTWSLMLRVILGALGIALPVGRSFFAYAGAIFANNVTPFGQAGGQPIAALIISNTSDARYEAGLAGIASVDVMNVITSVSIVLIAVGYYATEVAIGGRLQTAVGTAVTLVVVVGFSMAIGWRYRWRVVNRASGAVGAVLDRVVSERIDGDELARTFTDRAARFFGYVEEIATDRSRLATVLGLSLLGWIVQATALLAAFAAVGHNVSIVVLLFVIPLANVAGATPLPGGLGGIEAASVALLVPTTGIPAAEVTAAVLVFRGAIYWMPILLGGGSVMASGFRALA